MGAGLGNPAAGIVGRATVPLCCGVARGLCVLIGCAGVAVAPVTAKARELAAPAEAVATGTTEVTADGAAPAEAVATETAEVATDGAAPVAVSSRTRLPAVEVTTAKKVRHDWYVGAGFGLGAGNFQADGGVSGALTGLARVGGRLTDKIAMGGIVVTSFGGTDTGLSGITNLLVEALFFPVKGRGLGLAVGLGLSSAWLRELDMSGVLVDRKTQTGAGFGAGLGYDFWLARRFNLGLWVRGDGSGGRYGLRASGHLGLMFSWY